MSGNPSKGGQEECTALPESSTPEGAGDAGLETAAVLPAEAVPGDAPGEEDVPPVRDAVPPGNGDPAVPGDPEADPGDADDPRDAPEEGKGDEGGVTGGSLGV